MASGSRGRPRKMQKGTSRMDAALDHLLPLGFLQKDITNAVNTLLEVYGGEDCWLFLETEGYKEVIDYILENPKCKEEQKTPPKKVKKLLNVNPVFSPDQQNTPQNNVKPEHEEEQSEIDEETRKKMKMDYLNKDFSNIPVISSEEIVRIIPPGISRPPCFGYLSETDSDSDDDDEEGSAVSMV